MVEQYLVISWIVVAACTALVGKVASFVGKIFVVRPSTTKTTNILPYENYPPYGTVLVLSVLLLE